MFKGLFNFKQSVNIRWVIISPILVFIFLGLISLSSTSDLSVINSPFYKQCLCYLKNFLGQALLNCLINSF